MAHSTQGTVCPATVLPSLCQEALSLAQQGLGLFKD